jgi:hypothetical protein
MARPGASYGQYDNWTVYEHTAPRIAQIAKGGELQPLLPGPTN